MAANSDLSNTTPVWLMISCAVLLVARSFLDLTTKPQPMSQHTIKWMTFEQADKSIFTVGKPAWIFITHGDECARCVDAERQQERESAQIINKYIPVRLIDSRLNGKPRTPLESRIISWTDAPSVIVVTPQNWEHDGKFERTCQYEFYSILGSAKNQFSEFLKDPTASRSGLAREFSELSDLKKAPPLLLPAVTETFDRDLNKKPVVLFFMRVRDSHDLACKNDLFSDENLSKLIKDKYSPMLVLNTLRANRPNAAIVDRLIAKFRIKEYPALVVYAKGKDPQKFPGELESKAVSEFLEQAYSSPANQK